MQTHTIHRQPQNHLLPCMPCSARVLSVCVETWPGVCLGLCMREPQGWPLGTAARETS